MRQVLATLMSTALIGYPVAPLALPQDGTVTQGNASFTQSGNTLTVNQQSQQTLIDWRTFNIGSAESVNFVQPGTSSLAINRVSEGTSTLNGNLTANGQLWLFNPNGVLVGPGAHFNTGSLVLSAGTFNEEDESWLAGPGTLTNQGQLTTQNDLTLLASQIDNQGTLTSNGGTIQLLAAQTAHVPLSPGGLITAAVAPATTPLKLENTGAIITPGGTAQLALQAVDNPHGGILNTTGLIAANTVAEKNGQIILGYAPQTTVGGTLTATGANTGETGGHITVTGKNVTIANNTLIDASGQVDGGQINIGGAYQGGPGVTTAHNTTVGQGASLAANALTSGNGGQVVVWADNTTKFNGKVEAKGGSQSGNGGQLEVSGKQTLIFRGDADASAANGKRGSLLLDPQHIVIADGAGPEADDAEVADGDVQDTDGGAVTFTIAEQALEGIAAGTDIYLEATDNITINNLTDNTLGLTTTGNVSFVADSDGSGVGDFTMDSGDTISTGGATLSINGANLTLGDLDTSAGAGGALALTTTGSAGTITYGSTLNSGGSAGLTLAGGLTRTADVDLTNVGAITLSGNSTLQSTAGAIVLGAANTFDGGYDLNLAAATNITTPIVGSSTPLNSFVANATGSLTPLGNITTSGGQINLTSGAGLTTPASVWQLTSGGGNIVINNALTLAAATTLNSGGGGITLGNTVDGAFGLTLTSGAGNSTLSGAVGGSTPLTTLAHSGNLLTISNGVATSGAQTYTNAVNSTGTLQSSAGAISFGGALTLGGTTAVTTAGANNITFGSTINGAQALTVTPGTTGTAAFNGIAGGSTPLASLAVVGTSDINAALTTSGNQTYTGNTDVGGALSGNAITIAGGTTNLANNITTAGNLSVGGSTLTLGGNSILTSGGGGGNTLTLATNITGANTLELVGGTDVLSLMGIDVATLTLTSGGATTLNGNILTDTALDASNIGALTLATTLAITAGNGPGYADLTLGSANTITGGGNALTLTGDTVTLGGTANGLASLAVTGATAVNLDADITTTGTQTYTGDTTLGSALASTNNTITLDGNTTLDANSTISTGAGAGDIAFTGTVDGGFTLGLSAGTGAVTAAGAMGGSTPLTSLTLSAATASLLGVATTGAIDLTTALTLAGTLNAGSTLLLTGTLLNNSGGALTAADDLTVTGAITLADDLTITSGGGAAHQLTLGNGAAGDYALTLIAGSGDIDLTGNFDLDALTISSGNTLTYGGGTITTDNAILFTALNNLYLDADTTITAMEGSTRADVTMGSSNIILATTTGVDLAITGAIVTLYQVGDNGAGDLDTLTIDAATAVLLGDVYTTGAQTITATEGLAGLLFSSGGDITLNTAASLVADVTVQSNGGDVYFNNVLNGGYNLTVDASGGDIYLNANLGDSTPLNTVSMNGTNIYLLGNLTTQGTQTFTGEVYLGSVLTSVAAAFDFYEPVTLQANAGLRTLGGGGINFYETVDGNYNLLLGPGSGNVTAHKAMGATTPLGVVTVANTTNVTYSQGLSAAGYQQTGTTGTTTFGGTGGLTSTGQVTIATTGPVFGHIGGTNLSINTPSWVGSTTADTLALTSGYTNLTGSLGGRAGRQATFNLQLGGLYGGPNYFNGYALPLHELSLADAALGATGLPGWDAWGATLPTPVILVEDETTPLL